MSNRLRLAVLISGSGSNLQAIIDAIENGELPARIVTVVSNNPDAYGLQRARDHQLTTRVIDHCEYSSRARYEQDLAGHLLDAAPDIIVLAGYMRILGANFVARFPHRILNIHPSLLPAYKGLDTHQRALDNGEAEHGVSIHLVTAELDDGPILAQGSYSIEPGDSVADLQARGHRLEHRMYPQVLRWIADGKLILADDGRILYEQQPLDSPLRFSA